MKKIYAMSLMLITFYSFGQDFRPFHSGSQKLYAENPSATETWCMFFDSVETLPSGVSVYYHQTYISNVMLNSMNCMFWGGPYCNPQDQPSVFGKTIMADIQGNYHFFNADQALILMNFNLAAGDSVMFYQDTSQRFYLVSEARTLETVLNVQDSMKVFHITHTDLNGNPVNSTLNHAPVRIGKQLGITDFFRIDVFPHELKGLTLLGNRNPDAGFFRITNADLYDYQPLDVVQNEQSFNQFGGPPSLNYHRFVKHTFLVRNETADSLIYTVRRSVFEAGNTFQTTDTITLSYAKATVLAEIPFDKIVHTTPTQNRLLHKVDYCGQLYWTYTLTPLYLTYCQADNCWGSYDTQGPPAMGETDYVPGLGIYINNSYVTSPIGYSSIDRIIYFKKGSHFCGQEAITGLESPTVSADDWRVYPNPAANTVSIRFASPMEGILTLYNIMGQEVMRTPVSGIEFELNLERIPRGTYFIRVIDKGNTLVRKLVLENGQP